MSFENLLNFDDGIIREVTIQLSSGKQIDIHVKAMSARDKTHYTALVSKMAKDMTDEKIHDDLQAHVIAAGLCDASGANMPAADVKILREKSAALCEGIFNEVCKVNEIGQYIKKKKS